MLPGGSLHDLLIAHTYMSGDMSSKAKRALSRVFRAGCYTLKPGSLGQTKKNGRYRGFLGPVATH